MELWFIYAIISALAAGVFTFMQKKGVQEGFNSQEYTKWILFFQSVGSLLAWIVFDRSLENFSLVLLLGAITGVTYSIIHLFRAISLENIDVSLFFPLTKTIGPTLVVLIAIIALGEKLTTFDVLGIIFGVFSLVSLIDRKERGRQKNMRKGFLFLFFGLVISVSAVFLVNYLADSGGSILLFAAIQGIVGFGVLLIRKKVPKGATISATNSRLFIHAIIAGAFNVVGIYYFLKAIEVGLISIVYTINSFYILIPIVLSVVIYREHINYKKALAIVLSIVAIAFFQI